MPEVMIPQAIMTMRNRGQRHSGPALDLNAPPSPLASRIKPDYSRTRVVQEAVGDPMNSQAGMTPPGSSTPSSSINDKGTFQEKLAHMASEVMKESLPYAERKKALLQLAKILDDEAKAEGETVDGGNEPPAEPEPANAPPEEPATPAAETPPEPEEPEEEEEPEMEEAIKALKDSSDPADKELYESIVKELKEEKSAALALDAKKAKKAMDDKIAKARSLCEEAKLGDFRKITDVLLEEIASGKDERAMKAIVQDKLNIAARQRPVSMPGYLGGGSTGADLTTDQFVAALG